MESHEILKNAFTKTSPKAISSELGVSLSLVYKWAQEQSSTGSGSRNPLDRVLKIIELTEDPAIMQWLCARSGGYFVRNPSSDCEKGFEYLPATTEIVAQFSLLLSRISQAAFDDSIDTEESMLIREQWDKLKCYAEGFVRCCEEGDFEKMKEVFNDKEQAEPRRTLY